MESQDLPQLTHWHTHWDTDNILWLTIDKAGSQTNVLSKDVLQNLQDLLIWLDTHPKPIGLIVQSGKRSGFILGADLQEFKTLDSKSGFEVIRLGQTIFDKLESLPFPTLALIEGYCLGGGLELALACDYRIAEDNEKILLGLPEVKLGIHPGWGGTVRLPRLIGGPKAMDLILSGRMVSAKVMKKMGGIDYALPKRQLLRAARSMILSRPAQRKATLLDKLSNLTGMRYIIGKFLNRKLSSKVSREHYPAPFQAVEHWVKDGVEDSAFLGEAHSIASLFESDTARNLLRVFQLQEKLKSLSKGSRDKPKTIHIVGVGVMGSEIAALCALKGLTVTLQDQDNAAIAKALSRIQVIIQKQLKEPYLIRRAQDRIIPDKEGYGIAFADIILEAVIEKKEVKQALFKALEEKASPDALLATNTSTLPLEVIGEQMKNPDRLVGLHFFNPPTKMLLVEVVESATLIETVRERALAFVRLLDKLPLPVKSSPGFLVNRCLAPYLFESMQLLEEGVPASVIDKTAKDFGMPMGPIELADTVGLDVCLYAGETLMASKGKGAYVPENLLALIQKGHLGKKTGQGFYQYNSQGKRIDVSLPDHYQGPEDIMDRLLLRIVNECVGCLREKIVTDKDGIDAGMIFGTGFPPFRGGPLHYVQEQGEAVILQRLQLLFQRYGERFTPDEGWSLLEAN